QAWLADQRLSQAKPLTHTLGVSFYPTVHGVGQTHPLQQGRYHTGANTLETGKVIQHLETAELLIELDIVGQVAQPQAHIVRLGTAGDVSEHLDLTAVWPNQTEDELHGGGFAGPVMAHQAQHFTFRQGQTHLVKNSQLAETLADRMHLNHGLGHCTSSAIRSGRAISGWLSRTPGGRK